MHFMHSASAASGVAAWNAFLAIPSLHFKLYLLSCHFVTSHASVRAFSTCKQNLYTTFECTTSLLLSTYGLNSLPACLPAAASVFLPFCSLMPSSYSYLLSCHFVPPYTSVGHLTHNPNPKLATYQSNTTLFAFGG